MITKTLGRTGLEVTQLGFGAMELRGPKVWGGREVSESQSETILNAVLDAGINFVDTAVDYGLSEERIGRHISSRRDEYVLATKCGCNPQDLGDHWETPHLWTDENLRRNIAGSLERMKTDHVDILQLHNAPVDDIRAAGLIDTLLDIKAQGMTRFIGISATVGHMPDVLEFDQFDTFQIPYSCLQPEHDDMLRQVGATGVGVIIRGGIAMGGPGSDVPERVPAKGKIWQAAALDELLGDMTPAELILRYTLSHPYCHTTIVGTFNPAHLAANLAATAKGPLDADLYDQITQRVSTAIEEIE